MDSDNGGSFRFHGLSGTGYGTRVFYNGAGFSAKIVGMRDNWKFLSLGLATLLLIAALVIVGRRQETLSGTGARVDVKRVEQLVSEGRLTLHPAEFGKPVDSLEEADGQ